MDAVVRRLYGCLVEALERRGHPEHLPVTVAEIQDELVPYQEVRPVLDVDLKADYEHALLRLLAGADGLLVLEPEEARAELQREAASTNPDVGSFRKFAGSDVWVRKSIELPEERAVRLHEEQAEAPDPPPAGHALRLHRGEPAEPGESLEPAICIGCAEPLPPERRVRFCPHCGRDQRLRHCPGCAAVLEQGWRYCIACGREAAPG